MSIHLSGIVTNVAPSQTMSISAIANSLRKQGKDVINLAAGEPAYSTPDVVKEAGINAIRDGKTRYTPVDGIEALKKAICEKFKRENNLDYTSAQILVSCGAKHSLYNLFQALLNDGDEVIIPVPYWVSYPEIVRLAGGVPIEVQCDKTYKLRPQALAQALTPRTRALILNSPNNPSGVLYEHSELKELADVLLQHPQIVIASDDIYEHLIFGKKFENIVNVCPDMYERTVVINGVSKSYAMTGWRIGYAAGNEALIKGMKIVQSHSTSNPNSIAQHASICALQKGGDFIAGLRERSQKRRNIAYQMLSEIDIVRCIKPDGSFYIFPDVSEFIAASPDFEDDLKLSEYLLTNMLVATVPGIAFGAPGHIRISCSIDTELLKEGVQRIQQVLTGSMRK